MRPIHFIILAVVSIIISSCVIISRVLEKAPKPEPQKAEPQKTRFDWVKKEDTIYVFIDKERQIEYVLFWKDKNGAVLLDKHKLNVEKP